MKPKTFVRSLMVAVLIATGSLAFASSASALGGEQGELLIKGPGSIYAGMESFVSLSVAAGATASFAFEVRNTGLSTAQFNIQVTTGTNCAASCTATPVVSTGSLVVTSLAMGPNGYFTAPIAPGAVATYALKVTPSKTGATPGDDLFYQLRLADTAGTQLHGYSFAGVNITRSVGTTGAEQFASSSGTPATSGNAVSQYGLVTAPSVPVDKTYAYTVKLVNDSATAGSIRYQLAAVGQCGTYFPIRVMQGSTNVTLAALRGTYSTPKLAHGASVTLTLTGTSTPGGADCLATNDYSGTSQWQSIARDSAGDLSGNVLLFSPAAS